MHYALHCSLMPFQYMSTLLALPDSKRAAQQHASSGQRATQCMQTGAKQQAVTAWCRKLKGDKVELASDHMPCLLSELQYLSSDAETTEPSGPTDRSVTCMHTKIVGLACTTAPQHVYARYDAAEMRT